MNWSLSKSRNLYFNETGDDRKRSAWAYETQLLATAGLSPYDADELAAWDPNAEHAQANCPVLHEVLNSLKDSVGPAWKARARNIYAGRTRSARVPAAMAATGSKGGAVAIGFDFTYCLLGAAITWSDFLEDADAVRANPILGSRVGEARRAALAAFSMLRTRGVDGIEPSKIFSVRSKDQARSAAEVQQRAEVWVVGHELAHHILRSGTSRPDRDAARQVQAYLDEPGIAVELRDVTAEQHDEIAADVLAYLLTSGEFVDGRDGRREMICGVGALLGLLAIGLLDDDWTSSDGCSHPGTLTRMAVVARLSARRILEDHSLVLEERERLVRTLASLLAYGAWISGGSIAPPPRGDHGDAVVADVAHASTRLLIAWPDPIFDDSLGGTGGSDPSSDSQATGAS